MPDTTADDQVRAKAAEPDSPLREEAAEPDSPPWGPAPPSMIGVGQLTAHPGNVRQDLDLTPEFLASVAEMGVRVPLLITPDEAGGFRIIEGHRRLAAALKAGLAEVPCVLDAGRAGDQAGQFLDMLVANSGGYRKNLTPVEEAAALFAAHEAGATKTRIRKSTGRKADEVKTALAVGGMSGQAKEAAGELARELSLDQLALLAEFDSDPAAVEQILAALRDGYSVEYVAERIRQDRAEAADHDKILGDLAAAELEAVGTPVTVELPDGAVRLTALVHDQDDLTPEAHANCPGRGVFFPTWSRLHPVHYCTDPAAHGHAVRSMLLNPGAAGGPGAEVPDASPVPPADGPPDPGRKLVIEGNKAWKAASEVRKRWLSGTLFARRTAPREAAPFIAGQLLTMPDPLRSGLPGAAGSLLFSEITGRTAAKWLETCDTIPAARLPLLMLGPIVTAYETAMTEGEGKNTWRTGRYSPCPRRAAATYLAFLASIGNQLSAIEQALTDDVPYTGDTPGEPELTDSAASPDDTAESPGTSDGGSEQDASPDAA
jgi:ParB-like chromosome segregation protein Spo0J